MIRPADPVRRTLVGLLVVALTSPALLAAAPKAQKRTEWEYLRNAYKTLSKAKHNYKGHRGKAMAAIESACDLMGHDVRGAKHKGEAQDLSDAQLREARNEVNQALAIVQQNHQPKILHHLQKALSEIDLALQVK